MVSESCEQGEAQMLSFNLGVCANGKGVREDDHFEAVKCFGKPPSRVHASAQFNLGRHVRQWRRECRRMTREAVKWYRKAAEQGYCQCSIQPWALCTTMARGSAGG